MNFSNCFNHAKEMYRTWAILYKKLPNERYKDMMQMHRDSWPTKVHVFDEIDQQLNQGEENVQ